jgi:hypothetical protein
MTTAGELVSGLGSSYTVDGARLIRSFSTMSTDAFGITQKDPLVLGQKISKGVLTRSGHPHAVATKRHRKHATPRRHPRPLRRQTHPASSTSVSLNTSWRTCDYVTTSPQTNPSDRSLSALAT